METRKGFSLIEFMIVIAVFAILAAVAAPFFSEQIKLAHETAAVQQIKTLHTMQAQYYAQFGRYANNLTELGPPPAGAGLIPRTLANGRKSGYLMDLQSTADGYALTAVPEKFGSTGRRTFYSDHTQVIHQNWSREPADADSPEI
ncbi:MAG TPA: prepilin-type N-terminal cleavage/methylation domain-containing protein [Bryobacteraceae bacterium]|nr:prepilin-type N-terminal cleavage/methylation domain-containing protein [Bryobacteraceae bacterium]